jgi:hypothetical protein
MDAITRKKHLSNRLMICLILSLCAVLLPAMMAYFDLEMYATYALQISLFSLALSVATLMLFLANATSMEGVRAGSISILIFISLCGNIIFPLLVTSQLNDNIKKYLNDTGLYYSMAIWPEPANQQSNTGFNLAAISPKGSVAIMQKYGDILIYSELNSSLTHKILAHGTKNLRYVVVIDEIQASETLSAKWEAYYKRGWDVSKPVPVRYIQIDWNITLVDLKLQQVLARTTLTAEPPSDYYRPLSSRVEIRPEKGLLFTWLGY